MPEQPPQCPCPNGEADRKQLLKYRRKNRFTEVPEAAVGAPGRSLPTLGIREGSGSLILESRL